MAKSSIPTKAYEIIRSNGLVVYPANVGYALFGHSDESMQCMFRIKGRPLNKSCVIIANLAILEEVTDLTDEMRKGIEAVVKDYPCAFVVPAQKESKYLDGLGPWARDHLVIDGYVALFLNIGELSSQLVELGQKDNYLIIGSSANLSGKGNNYTFADIEKEIIDGAQGAFDAGPSLYTHPQNMGTTIVNFRTKSIQRDGILCPEIVARLAENGLTFKMAPV